MSKKKSKKGKKSDWVVCPVTGRRIPPGYVYAPQGAGAGNGGLLGGITRLLPSGRTEQFLLGAAIGAGAAYVLGDDQMRAKLLKAGVQLYNGVVGGFEELKEQVADLQAELQAGQTEIG